MSEPLLTHGQESTSDITDFEGYLNKLSSEFTDEERAWFVDSFSRHMQYRCNPSAFVVSIDDAVTWLGFNQKITATRLLMSQFKEGHDFTTALGNCKAVHMHGGHNKLEYKLNVKTFKKMCMIAKTAKADTVRDYYIRMEEVLLDHIDYARRQAQETALFEKEVSVSETLLNQAKGRNVFYIAKMETLEEDNFVFKIGNTEDIKERTKSLRQAFGVTPIFLDVIATDLHEDLERFMLRHQCFRDRKYEELVNGKHKSRECFRGTMADFKTVLNIAKKKSFSLGSIDKLTALEFAQLKLKETELRVQEINARVREAEIPLMQAHASLVETCSVLARMSLSNPQDTNLQNQYDRALQVLVASKPTDSSPHQTNDAVHDDPVFASATPKVDLRHGRAVQRYDATTLNFVDSFAAITLALQECGDDNSGSPSGLKKAIEGNHVYLGHRWMYAPENAPQDTPVAIPETVVSTSARPGLVAKLHPSMSKVVDVYTNQKQASEAEGLKSSQTITLAIHNINKLARGHRWMYWKDVDSKLQDEFLEVHVLPEEFGRPGRSIRQMDAISHAVIHVHRSIGVVCKKFNVGAGTVKNACREGHQMKGFAWEWVE